MVEENLLGKIFNEFNNNNYETIIVNENIKNKIYKKIEKLANFFNVKCYLSNYLKNSSDYFEENIIVILINKDYMKSIYLTN